MESKSSKPIAVYGAIAANFLIACAKFFASIMTGSSAMLSEGIHSLVDTGNGTLLLVGIKRGKKPADENHPFGHGKELYFWSLIVAILLFGLGGGMSFYEGIIHIQHPAKLGDPTWNYIVLAIAFLAEGTAWFVAMKEFKKEKGNQKFWSAFKASKNPSVFTIIAEDTAATSGVIVAFLGVYLGHYYNNPIFDGIASIVIGLILASVAIFLIIESKGLLVGESADKETLRSIKEIADRNPEIAQVYEVLTMHFGPKQILLNMNINFKEETPAARIPLIIDELENEIRKANPEIKRIFVEAEALRK